MRDRIYLLILTAFLLLLLNQCAGGGSSDSSEGGPNETCEPDSQQACGNLSEVRVNGTGLPVVDVANIKAALLDVKTGGTIRLVGRFEMTPCIGCIVITKPVTIQGSNCSLFGGVPDGCVPATAEIVHGLLPFVVAQTHTGTTGIHINNLHFHGQVLGPCIISLSLGLVEFDDNRVDDQTALPIGPVMTRTGLGSLQVQLFTKDPNVAAQYPELVALLGSGGPSLILGDVVYRRNYIDLLTNSPAPFIAEDNCLTAATCQNSSITMTDNVVMTHGDGIELEGCTNSDGVITITNNRIVLDATRSTEGTLYGWGSPAAIKMLTLANKSATVTGNNVTVTGHETATAVTAGTTSPDAKWFFQNNQFSTQGQLAAFVGGNAGVPPFFLGSSLSNAVITGNKFVGTAGWGVAFKDAPTFVNKATGNQVKNNDFTEFTPTTGYTIFLGAGTSNNVITGPVNGGVDDLGVGNSTVY